MIFTSHGGKNYFNNNDVGTLAVFSGDILPVRRLRFLSIPRDSRRGQERFG